MTYESLLVDTGTIQRYTEGTQDIYGNPALTWADHLANIDCRLMATAGRELKIGAEIVIADYKLFTEDIDVTERDRAVIATLTYEILLVEDKQDSNDSHHKELAMRISR